MAERTCSVEGCERRHSARGFCRRHHRSLLKYGDPLAARRPTSVERFWAKVDKRGPGECWPWTAYVNPSGYGHIRWFGRAELAHRVSFWLRFGPIPRGFCVLHSCDNPPCCNPAHLRTGSQADNAADARERGRLASGERSRSARFTEDEIAEIRAVYAAGGVSQLSLAERYGVRREAIGKIVRMETWR